MHIKKYKASKINRSLVILARPEIYKRRQDLSNHRKIVIKLKIIQIGPINPKKDKQPLIKIKNNNNQHKFVKYLHKKTRIRKI